MRILMLYEMQRPDLGHVAKGAEVDVDDAVGRGLVAEGYAKPAPNRAHPNEAPEPDS